MPDGVERPICYISRTLSKAEKNYAVLHKEALAIHWSVQKLYQDLMGIITLLYARIISHWKLKGIPQMAVGWLQRWAVFLSNFNYSLKYIKGTTSKADGLSRIPVSYRQVQDNSCEYINWIEDYVPINLKMVKQETQKLFEGRVAKGLQS